MNRHRMTLCHVLAAVSFSMPTSFAAPVTVPNASFESPSTVYVGLYFDSWQKTPKPDGYDESDGFTWDQLTGVFKNTPPTSADHIDNCDGQQAVWLFAVPGVGLFQDHQSKDWNDPEPTHDFDAVFEPGNAYRLTVGVIGGGGGMLPGATLEISLYHRDSQSNAVVVASTVITHGSSQFPNRTHLVDFQVEVPTVRTTDPWAGEHIGVSVISTVTTELQGGYWDLDNVRLESIREPALAAPTMTGEGFEFTLLSEPGVVFDILATEDLTLPTASWAVIGSMTNDTGSASFTDEQAAGRRFYELRQVP